jgi:3'-5' exoribonuclease
MPPRIDRVELSQLKPGATADFFAVLADKTARTTKSGNPFLSVKFRDRLRTVGSVIWGDAPLHEAAQKDWAAGEHFKVRAKLVEHPQYGLQLEIANARKVNPDDWLDGYNPDQFVLVTKFDVEEMFRELRGHAESLEDVALRGTLLKLLDEHAEGIKAMPAAAKMHHAFKGGWLEHVLSVVRNGVWLAEKYRAYYDDLDPPISRDLVVAGCILHDIGKLKELEVRGEETVYTPAGMLVGHILIGRDMLREAAASFPELSPATLLVLEHIILAHHGSTEFGSPKVPMTPEAYLVAIADDMDAKMASFVAGVRSESGDEFFSDYQKSLGRRVLKTRKL